MRIKDCDWQIIENYLKKDDRVVLPLGSVEQHARLSLCTDMILSEEISVAAAEPLGVPVYPAVPFGLTPYFMAYPGTISLKTTTYLHLIEDILDSLYTHGFRRIVIVNGHGGNQPAAALAQEWGSKKENARVKFHNWWNAPKTAKKTMEIDPVASHASWMESFPWTRNSNILQPEGSVPMCDLTKLRMMNPREVRDYVGLGNYGGAFKKSDAEMDALWKVGVEETRHAIEEEWV